ISNWRRACYIPTRTTVNFVGGSAGADCELGVDLAAAGAAEGDLDGVGGALRGRDPAFQGDEPVLAEDPDVLEADVGAVAPEDVPGDLLVLAGPLRRGLRTAGWADGDQHA